MSNEDYDSIKYNTNKTGSDYLILNGGILPKGHGRLIDADKYRRMLVDTFDSCYGDECANLFKDSVDNAQTIIEADKGSEKQDCRKDGI